VVDLRFVSYPQPNLHSKRTREISVGLYAKRGGHAPLTSVTLGIDVALRWRKDSAESVHPAMGSFHYPSTCLKACFTLKLGLLCPGRECERCI
jgi:hypothetical protein